MSERRMRQLIKKIPGEQGWWHSSGEASFQSLATKLREHGVPAEVVLDVLTDAYLATAEEFGQ